MEGRFRQNLFEEIQIMIKSIFFKNSDHIKVFAIFLNGILIFFT